MCRIEFLVAGRRNSEAKLREPTRSKLSSHQLQLLRLHCTHAHALHLAVGRLQDLKAQAVILHHLAFALGLHRAACEYVTGELGPAEARLAALATLAGTPAERAAVAGLRIDLHFTLDQSDRAISIGFEYLRQVGIDSRAAGSADLSNAGLP